MTRRPPSKKLIGARIRVRPEKADEAAKLFQEGGFEPIYVDHRDESEVAFCFGKASDAELNRLADSIPREFYAIQGIVVGDRHPFSLEDGDSS